MTSKRKPPRASTRALLWALLFGASHVACSVANEEDASAWLPAPSGAETSESPNTGITSTADSSPRTSPSLPGASDGSSVSGGVSPAATSGIAPGSNDLDGSYPNATELPARTWRLTHQEYQTSIKELLGVDIDLSNFAPESGNGKFMNFSSTSFVRIDLASNYLAVAKQVAAELPLAQLASLTSCNLDPSCSEAFISELARKAFRQPAPPSAVTRYKTILDTALTAGGDAETGFRAVLAGMLNSPFFLYRKETGSVNNETAPTFTLTSHEIAEQLSYSLLGAPPPDWLSQLADTESLFEAGPLKSAVTQLLADPRAAVQLSTFLTQWLEVHDFAETTKSDAFPGFAQAQPLMQTELTAFLSSNGGQQNTLNDLFLGTIPEASPALTRYYMSDESAQPGSTRSGVLGLGSVLADHAKSYLTSPTLRGTFIRRRFFCQEITLPPDFTPPPLSETEALKTARTTRELYEKHQDDPMCATCHRLTDYVGYVLEGFDGGGRFRTIDTTQGYNDPVNLVTELTGSDVDRPLTSPDELSRALAESAQVRQCMAQQAFRFYFGQSESSTQVPSIQAGNTSLNGGTLGALLTGLLTTESTFERVREPAL